MRRRTATDELAIREFFQEGDLLVAEVQTVFAEGGGGVAYEEFAVWEVEGGGVCEGGGGGRW